MNKLEFNKWVEEINETINNDKTVCFDILPKGIVIAYDTDKMKSSISKCGKGDIFDENTGKAIAYARLRDINVPTIEEEPMFNKVKCNEHYYSIRLSSEGFIPPESSWFCQRDTGIDHGNFLSNNYFHTKERAEEVINKMEFLLKLERLHDIYCPDYVPNWDSNLEKDWKYYVFYNYSLKCWMVGSCALNKIPTITYFPSQEIAEKVCDILNEENKNE